MAMQEQWESLYVRKNLDDGGQYPVNGTAAGCPDIIPVGVSPLEEPSSLISDESWKKSYGSTISLQRPNYVYVRGKNLAKQAMNGHLYLYCCPLSLVSWPAGPFDGSEHWWLGESDGWSKRLITTNSGTTSVKVSAAAGGLFVTEEPFLWIPEKGAGDRYSLIAQVVPAGQEKGIPPLGTINSFAPYVSEHPDVGWLNVTTAEPDYLAFSGMQTWRQGSNGSQVRFTLRCENFPDGYAVAMSSGTPGPVPALRVPETNIVNKMSEKGVPEFIVETDVTIPANWVSNIIVTFFTNGRPPAPGMRISFSGARQNLIPAARSRAADVEVPART